MVEWRRCRPTDFLWSDETLAHIAEHGITAEEVEEVVMAPDAIGKSRSTQRPCCWGLFCVFEKLDEVTILPITAYESRRKGG